MVKITAPAIIHTERLDLKLLTEDMARDMNDAITSSLKEFEPWFDWVHPKGPSLKDTEDFTKKNIEGQSKGEEFHYAVYLKGTNTLVARVSLDKNRPEVPSFNIGYWVHSHYTGNGYTTEATLAMVDATWNKLPIKKLEIYHDEENVASAVIIEKLVTKFGFEKLGLVKNALRRHSDNTLRHHVYYALTRDDEVLS
ncbi:MAG: GNAT family N-acetyltransferase [Pseudomonadota bacterium]|nr:GNAT family N-acetyltransferase [Pseudomonadota bacterium]